MLVRTRPFNPVFDPRLDRAFDQLTSSFLTPSRRNPLIDAGWTDGTLELTVDLPGVPGEAIDVSVAERTITVKVATEQLSWQRSVRLGTALDPEQVSARYVDGRLTVRVSPAASAEPRRIEVATSGAEEPAQPENGSNDGE
jgi:HSP20 family protein